MSQQDNMIKLYSQRILDLAAHISHTERLADPDGTAMRRSPLCGSTVTVDIALEDGRITGFGQDVKACALGQASAAIFAKAAEGLDRDTVAAGRDALAAMLKSDGSAPGAPFAELEVLEPAREYNNRHASILLVFDAALAAFDAALSDQS